VKYKEECKHIWKNLIPKAGQADNLQGELLRQIEKLRYEAQNNGNINWDSDFEYFCDFLNASLCEGGFLSADEKKDVAGALSKIKAFGQFMCRFNNGDVSDDEFDARNRGEFVNIMEDDLYDAVCDAVGMFYSKNKTPIPYKPNPDILR